MGVALMLIVFIEAQGQEREIDIFLGNILESVSDENADIEEITAVFLKLLNTPLDLNTASKEDLNNLFVLNDFQVESLLDYRKIYGRFYSVYELQYVDGFDKGIMNLLEPFITAGNYMESEEISWKFIKENISNELNFRTKRVLNNQKGYSPITKLELENKPDSRYLAGPQYLFLQLRSNLTDKFSFNLTAENDPGEPLIFNNGKVGPDFFSFSFEFKGREHIEKIIVGDFSAGFGQGLVFWSSFNPINFMLDPIKIKLTEQNFKSYHSAGESGYLRGAAVTYVTGKYRLNFALSYRNLDAKIIDKHFTVIYDTGEHNTYGRVSTKNSLGEGIAVANVSYNSDRFKIGYTFTAYGFDKKNGKSYSHYNYYQKYNGLFGNTGLDFVYVLNGVRFFGETALDFRLNPALIGGVMGYYRGTSYGLLLRYFSRNFNAPHSSPYFQNTRPNNEKGVRLMFSHKNIFNWNIYSSFDYTLFPGNRYRVSLPSYQFEGKIELTKSNITRVEKSIIIDYKRGFLDKKSESTVLTLNGNNKISVKGTIRYPVTPNIRFTNRVEANQFNNDHEKKTIGVMVYHDLKYSHKSDLFSISLRANYFLAKDWNNRIYVSESDITSLYSSLCYGEGFKYYCLINYNIFKGSSLKLKYSLINYLDRDKIGEGLSLIESPRKHEIKIQLNYRF